VYEADVGPGGVEIPPSSGNCLLVNSLHLSAALFEIGFKLRQPRRNPLPMRLREQAGTPRKITPEFAYDSESAQPIGLGADTIQLIVDKGGAYLLGVHGRTLSHKTGHACIHLHFMGLTL